MPKVGGSIHPRNQQNQGWDAHHHATRARRLRLLAGEKFAIPHMYSTALSAGGVWLMSWRAI